jgi:cytochrome c
LKIRLTKNVLLSFAFAVATFTFSCGASAFDEDAVKALTKKNDCTKCHAADKDKKGPSYKKIAAKYKGKVDAEEKVTKAITSGSKVKSADGTEAEHKIINTKDAKEIKNVVQWILAQ